MVKHRQLAPTVGPNSDYLPTNSMASPKFDNVLEKGTTLSFGVWIFVADGSVDFTSYVAKEQNIETPRHEDGSTQNNSPAQADTKQNLPKDFQEGENFDLIKRY